MTFSGRDPLEVTDGLEAGRKACPRGWRGFPMSDLVCCLFRAALRSFFRSGRSGGLIGLRDDRLGFLFLA